MSLALLLAVLAPSQVAPHPNFSEEVLTPPAALAAVALARGRGRERAGSRSAAPRHNEDRPWAVVAAAEGAVLLGTAAAGVGQLQELLRSSTDTCEVATLAVLLRHALTDLDDYRGAEETCEAALRSVGGTTSLEEPLGRAVVLLQLAAAKAEVGSFGSAREYLGDAKAALDACGGPQQVVVLSRGARMSAPGVYRMVVQGLQRVVQRNGASWEEDWARRVDMVRMPLDPYEQERRLALGGVLDVLLEDSLSRSAQQVGLDHTGVRHYLQDPVDSPLSAFLFATQASGDWSAAAQASRLLGSARYFWHGREPLSDREALRLARHGRDDKLAGRLARLVRSAGPLSALKAEVDFLASPRVPAPQVQARMAVLRAGAPMLNPSDANELVLKLLEGAALDANPYPGASLNLLHEEWRSAAAVVQAADNHDAVAHRLLQLVQGGGVVELGELAEQDLAAVVRGLDWGRVEAPTRSGWGEALVSREPNVGLRLSCQVAVELTRYDPERALEALHMRVAEPMQSLVAASLVEAARHVQVPGGLLERASSAITKLLQRRLQDAVSGSYSYGGVDVAQLAAVLSIEQPAYAIWDALIKYLEEPAVPDRDKSSAWDFLSRLASGDLPPEVLKHLAGLSAAAAASPDPMLWPDQRALSRLRARIAGGAVQAAQATTLLAAAVADEEASMRGDAARSIVTASQVVGLPIASALATVLLRDMSPAVRVMAVYAASELSDARDEFGLFDVMRGMLLDEEGFDVPRALISVASASEDLRQAFSDALVQVAASTTSPMLRREAEAVVRGGSRQDD